MTDLLEPVAEAPAALTSNIPSPPRTREAIRAEWRALVERIKTIPRDSAEGKRLRLRILELWTEEVDHIPEEEFAENREIEQALRHRRRHWLQDDAPSEGQP